MIGIRHEGRGNFDDQRTDMNRELCTV